VSWLLDTNVVSELRKGARCDTNVAAWYAAVESDEIYLSVVTVGELRKGIEKIRRRDDRAAAALEEWLAGLLAAFSDRILPVDPPIAELWGRFNVPDPPPVLDSLLAATASAHGLTLATRNVRDVARTGVACVNPFAA
jgi:toxin FitB